MATQQTDKRLAEELESISTHLDEIKRTLTHSQETEQALRKSEARFRAVVDLAVEAIIIADTEDVIVEWNPGAEVMFGHVRSEALGQPLTILVPERLREDYLRGLARLRASQESRIFGRTLELPGLRQDGTEFPTELTLSQWESEGGRFYIAIVRDVTERKLGQEELKFYSETLEAQFNIGRILAGPGQLLEKCRRALEELARISRSDIVILREMTETGTELRLVTQVGAERLGVEVPPIVNLDRGITGQTLTSREPVVVNDYPSDPRALSPHIEAGVKSMAVIPIQLDGAMVGVITMTSLELGHYTPERIRFITTIAAGLGMLLENARLREAEYVHSQQLEQRLKELEALNKLFQEHLNQRFAVVEAYQQLVRELESEPQNITQILERAKSVPVPDLQELLSDKVEQAQ